VAADEHQLLDAAPTIADEVRADELGRPSGRCEKRGGPEGAAGPDDAVEHVRAVHEVDDVLRPHVAAAALAREAVRPAAAIDLRAFDEARRGLGRGAQLCVAGYGRHRAERAGGD